MTLKFLPWVARWCDVLVIVVGSLNNQVTAMVLSETFAYMRVYLWIEKRKAGSKWNVCKGIEQDTSKHDV